MDGQLVVCYCCSVKIHDSQLSGRHHLRRLVARHSPYAWGGGRGNNPDPRSVTAGLRTARTSTYAQQGVTLWYIISKTDLVDSSRRPPHNSRCEPTLHTERMLLNPSRQYHNLHVVGVRR